jgi:peptidoglycan/xylan/chitin deacetylase (PgdA/CDA1 family)
MARGSILAGVGWGERLTPGVRILTYHRIIEDPQDPFSVAPRDFSEQMEALGAAGVVVPLDKALEQVDGRDDGRPSIVLTFDDGTLDFMTSVLPVLIHLRLPATLYVSPGRVGAQGFLGWDDLRTISAAEVRVDSHGLDHESLGALQPEAVWQQVSRSRGILEDRLGRAVSTLAYPYGTVRDFSDMVKTQVRRAGYRAACTSVNGVNRSGIDLFELRRTKIEQGDARIFRRILSGGLDGWAIIDRYLAVLQNRYA